jgi:hypothetical protein
VLVGVGCYLVLFGLRGLRTERFIRSLPPQVQADINDMIRNMEATGRLVNDMEELQAEKAREDAIKQVFAQYKV